MLYCWVSASIRISLNNCRKSPINTGFVWRLFNCFKLFSRRYRYNTSTFCLVLMGYYSLGHPLFPLLLTSFCFILGIVRSYCVFQSMLLSAFIISTNVLIKSFGEARGVCKRCRSRLFSFFFLVNVLCLHSGFLLWWLNCFSILQFLYIELRIWFGNWNLS